MKCYFLLLLFALFSCATPLRHGNNIKTSVDVDELPEIGLGISTTTTDLRVVEFDSAKHGERIIEDAATVYLTLHNGFSERKQLYAEKGDHIHLAFDGKNLHRTSKITGDRPPITEYLSRWKAVFPSRSIYTLPLPEFEMKLKETIQTNSSLLDSCESALNKASKKFVKLERARMKYLLGSVLVNYPYAHGWKNRKDIDADYYTMLENWIEEDNNYLDLPEYRTFVTHACSFLGSRNEENAATPYENVLKQIQYAARNFKQDEVIQRFIATWASEYVQRNGITQIEELDKITRERLTNPDLLSRYTSVYDSWKCLEPGNEAIDFIARDSTGKEYSLKNFRNGYVCLYIWQNVSPCLVEFAHLQELAPLFKEKNVHLVNLSIEPKNETWREVIRNKNLQTGTHLYLEGTREFLSKYHYSSWNVFQFILITPDGKIAGSHLPKASSGELEKYLKEQL
ncbi:MULTISPECIES: peroxiredoxin family protein [Butyricimonas]|uniref:peroxiredoxin family protein n=1 Tax=Butyricimonas TaxID=574697 RepID=UPI0007FB2BF1|nr:MULTISPECIES: redoxin domain-containing protein [Butyricimonas]